MRLEVIHSTPLPKVSKKSDKIAKTHVRALWSFRSDDTALIYTGQRPPHRHGA